MRHGCPSWTPRASLRPRVGESERERNLSEYSSRPSKRTRTRTRKGDSLPSSIWEQLNIHCVRALGAASCVSEYDERLGKREDLSKRRAPKIIPETMTMRITEIIRGAREREILQ